MPASPLRFLRRTLLALPLIVLTACSDSPTPLEPRIDARPHALVGPVATVTNTDDSGPGSLRQTVIDAVAGTTIQFAASIAGQTIVLTSGYVLLDKSLTIEGPSTGITVSGGLSSRVFYVDTDVDAVLRNLSIVDGRDGNGGAVKVGSGSLTLDHVLVANNEALFSGGGIELESDLGQLTLLNSTLSGNGAAVVGGAIASSGSVTIRNSTIAYNVAGDGGGVWSSSGSFSLRNSIIANNSDDDASNAFDPNCVVKGSVAFVYTGRNFTNEDPCDTSMEVVELALAPLAANGGPTRTHALGAFSFAIDAGTSCSEATDQRYVARPQGRSCDVGAFEFNDFGTYTVTIGPNVAVNAKTGVVTLTGTVKCSKPTNILALDVGLSQTQKTTGRFTTIIEATGSTNSFPSCGPTGSSWSVVLTPQSGKFQPGAATGTATTTITSPGFLPTSVTSALKVFQLK